jgi:hypothetical protein
LGLEATKVPGLFQSVIIGRYQSQDVQQSVIIGRYQSQDVQQSVIIARYQSQDVQQSVIIGRYQSQDVQQSVIIAFAMSPDYFFILNFTTLLSCFFLRSTVQTDRVRDVRHV